MSRLKEVFSNKNIIEDEENIYFLRALNKEDHYDFLAGKNTTIRTDGERYFEKFKEVKYNSSTNISLQQVYDHIKYNHSKQTECISLSKNANVSLEYGGGYFDEYIFLKIPKTDLAKNNIYNAGLYMLEELDKFLEREVKKLDKNSKVIQIINQIENAENCNQIKKLILNKYKDRFEEKQYFTEEQQLEYDRVIAKLTILEEKANLKNVIAGTKDNALFLSTIGSAFSSGEYLHYGNIKQEEFTMTSKPYIELLAFAQQLKEKKETSKLGNELQKETLKLMNSNTKIQEIKRENKDTDLSVAQAYEITNGKINYNETKELIQFIQNISNSRIRAKEYAQIVRQDLKVNPLSEEMAKAIEENCFSVEPSIITRENGIGIKIAESVNIGNNEEELKLVDIIKSKNMEELKHIENEDTREIFNQFLKTYKNENKQISEHDYYTETIINNLDLQGIYKNYEEESARKLSSSENEILIKNLEKINTKKLYESFENLNISPKDISGYIINLLMDGSYDGKTIEELSKDEKLNETIEQNIKMLNNKVKPLRLDYLLEIRDNSYHIPNTYFDLKDYQVDAVKGVQNIYEKDKRVASVILPTGAGKSFVTMAMMMQYRDSNMIYFAPNTSILYQFQCHIVRNILNKEIVDDEEYADGIDKIHATDINQVVEEAFPHLKMFCYKSLTPRNREILAKYNAKYIILDEAHRTGAETWEPEIINLIKENDKAKILTITATPERDFDGKDMPAILAQEIDGYTKEQIENKEYLASEIYLIEAMQERIVNVPKVVTCQYGLKYSSMYKNVSEMLKYETDMIKKAELQEIYDNMRKIINNDGVEGISRIFADKESGMKKDGKYIVFIPRNPETNKQSAVEYIEKEIEKFKSYVKNIDANPEIVFLSSERNKAENIEALEKFENSKSNHLKLIFSIDMLNEGVHVEGIDGAVMLRAIPRTSKIKYLQQIGRCINAYDENNPHNTVIYDIANNFLEQNMDKQVNKHSKLTDYRRLQRIVNWIKFHNGYFPNIEEDIETGEEEVRKAISLRRIKERYEKYLDDAIINNSNSKDAKIIQKIIDLGNEINLWEREIPKIEFSKEQEEKLDKIVAFQVKGVQYDFLELYNKAIEIKGKRKITERGRVEIGLQTLDMLRDKGFVINNKTIPMESTLKDILEEFDDEYKKEILEEIEQVENYPIGQEYEFVKSKYDISKLKKEFLNYDIENLVDMGIFEEYQSEKGHMYFERNKNITDTGFIYKGPKEFLGYNIYTKSSRDKDGYDSEGRDKYGFTRHGQKNKYGFLKDKTHSETNTLYDPRGFDIDHIHKDTKTKFDLRGFDINKKYHGERRYDDKYFDVDGYHYKKNKRGNYTRSWSIYDDNGFDVNEIDVFGKDKNGVQKEKVTIDDRGFNSKGYHIKTLQPYDEYYFGRDNLYWKENASGWRSPTIRDYQDEEGFNVEGVRQDGFKRNGTNIYTGTSLSKANFDINGYFYRKNEKGEMVNTGSLYDDEGYDFKGFDKLGFNKEGYAYNEEGTYGRINKRGFYQDGIHSLTGTPYNYKNFNIEGKNKITGLNYDIRFFDIDGKNVLTGTDRDIRGFDEKGENPFGEIYDGRGFDVKGFHRKTKTLYNEEGFNAYGINKDGIDKETGKIHENIVIAKDYMEAVFERKRNIFVKEYAAKNNIEEKEAYKKLKLIVNTAGLMYPPIHEQIEEKVKYLIHQIKVRNNKIKKLQSEETENETEIEKLEKQNKILEMMEKSISLKGNEIEEEK